MSDTPTRGFQITSDPDTTSVAAPDSGNVRERDPGGAFRIMLVSDLDPQATVADWSAESRVQSVDANTFADVMTAHAPRFEVSVADHIGGGERRTIEWSADALDAFTPFGIARRVPSLAALWGARAAVEEARLGQLQPDALRERLRSTGVDGAEALADAVMARPSGSGAPSADDALSTLLGLVALPGDDTPASSSGPLDALVSAAVGDGTGVDSAAAATVVAGLDTRIGAQALAALQHPDVQRAEAAWRSLRFLVDRLAFRKGARLDFLAAPRAEFDAAIHFQVLLPEHAEGVDRTALAAIIVDHGFDATSADLTFLGDLAATGASLQIPVVTSAAPSFFGLGSPTDFSRLPPASALLDQQPYAAFKSLRTRPDAAFLALAVPQFVLRPAFGADHKDKHFAVEGGEVVWGSGAILAAAAMGTRHASTGWPTLAAGTTVEDLIVRKTRMGALPLSAAFGESVLRDLAHAGVLSFSGPLQSDKAVLGPAATTARPADTSPDAQAKASLPSAVFTALASHKALQMGQDLAGSDAKATLSEIDARFRLWLRGEHGPLDEDAVTVQLLEEHETEATHTYGIRLRPPIHVLASPVGVVIGVDVSKEAASIA